MMKAFAVWKWSLGTVARSYRTVIALAALAALWAYAAYVWLSLPESSVLMLIIAFIWAVVQVGGALAIAEGTVAGAIHAAATGGRSLPVRSLRTISGKSFLNTLLFAVASLVLVWLCSIVFGWINGYTLEVASFLTFHSQKAVSHVPIEEICSFIEGLLWIVVSGYLLSFFIVLLREGWREAGRQRRTLLAGCAFRIPFVTSLLSVAGFGGIAYELVNWHPILPPGFWDYAQMVVRFSLALISISAGILFWSLSLAHLQMPERGSSQG
jgi:hypothetical protein